MYKKDSEIAEEFRENFPELGTDERDFSGEMTKKEVIDHILTLRRSDREAIMEYVRKLKSHEAKDLSGEFISKDVLLDYMEGLA